jgi:AraC-like DNA-binding protein
MQDTAAEQTGWRRLSPDLIVGAIDCPTAPGTIEVTETFQALGVTDMACKVEVEGSCSAIVGPDVVRRHSPGDRFTAQVGQRVRARWLLASPSLVDWSSPSFQRPPLPDLARIRRALSSASRVADPLCAEELALRAFAAATLHGPQTQSSEQSPLTPRSARLVAAANDALRARFSESLRVQQLARDLGVSPSYLARIYRTHEGRTLYEQVTRLRVSTALARLGSGANDLTRLAFDLGFSSHSHFSSAFKRLVGQTPSAFRIGSQI